MACCVCVSYLTPSFSCFLQFQPQTLKLLRISLLFVVTTKQQWQRKVVVVIVVSTLKNRKFLLSWSVLFHVCCSFIPGSSFRYFCSRLNEKWEFSSYLKRNCCCTASERKLTSLWRLGHWTDCLSWEDRLVSSVSLFACCLPTFQKTSACSGPETLLVAAGTSYIDHLVGCIASW